MGNSMAGSMIGYDQDHTMKVESVRQSFTANQKLANSAHNKNKSITQVKQIENQKVKLVPTKSEEEKSSKKVSSATMKRRAA